MSTDTTTDDHRETLEAMARRVEEALGRLAREREAVDVATRKLHELITDAKDVRRQLREDVHRLQGQTEALLAEIVAREITALQAANRKAMDAAARRVFDRFDELANVLMSGPDDGGPGVEEMVQTLDHLRRTEPGQIHEHLTPTKVAPRG